MNTPAETPEYLRRMQWRCRRGLLELDIVLGRFVDTSYAKLDAQQRTVFDTLLNLPDTELWDLITGKKVTLHGEQEAVLAMLKIT